jgi:hypothetical protein
MARTEVKRLSQFAAKKLPITAASSKNKKNLVKYSCNFS